MNYHHERDEDKLPEEDNRNGGRIERKVESEKKEVGRGTRNTMNTGINRNRNQILYQKHHVCILTIVPLLKVKR